MILIKNSRIYDFNRFIPNGFVAFDHVIVKVGDMTTYEGYAKECKDNGIKLEEIDGGGKMLMPGLVLGHTHIYSSFARGWLTPFDPKSFQDVLDQMWWKLDGALGEEEIYYSGIASAQAYLKQGITTIIDHHASGKMIRGSLNTLKKAVVDEMGLRGIFCFETSDRFDTEQCIQENVDFYEEMKQGKCHEARGILGLHASFSLSDKTLSALSKTPKGMPIHIHVAESVEDVIWTKKHCNKTIMERLSQFDLLRKGSLYVHGVHLEEKDYGLIKESGGYMAFNPSSNMNNGVGLPQINKAIQYKIPWIIGNDGLGFGLSRDIQTVMFASNINAPNTFALRHLRESILNSYEYVSRLLACKLGCIEEGYEADLILLEYDAMTPMNEENAFGHFAYGLLDQWHPKEVWIKGIHRVEGYHLVKDMSKTMEEVEQCARQLWNRIK